ncbi:allantoate amidohydrolase [Nesterenkonia lutea]|uniref:Allantoate deiminase n=1 Tax=Nesterenkonia lutea TaxID=272919 RepID=A0ABR9JFH9_9MICC|nr:allantoate amidohydrolase [Nesterenkonia lutea]MBE1524686.1 allantoate deiminase [Nesterenkonia lutea]
MTIDAAAARIMARCDELAAISALPDGILRAYLTEEHQRHNALAAAWMTEVGMETWQDAAGNQCARLEGREPGLPALIIASHLDTVPDAGRYDGIMGVLLGIETARLLGPHARELPFAVEIVAFADEEGARFGATLLGSRAMAGTWDPHWWEVADAEGISMAQAFWDFGLDPEKVDDAARSPEELVGYLEAHIEQGPYLEAAQRPLGLVSSIAGARRFRLAIQGEARHAGGTPYERRRDALIGAAQAVLDVERIGRERGVIATVGQLETRPGAVNVVPGEADLSLDLRAESDELRDAAWEEIHTALAGFCAQRNLELTVEEIHSAPTVTCSERLRRALAAGVAATGDAEPITLYSRAGHDAMAMASVTDVAMLFTRCEDGISHHPQENVMVTDVALALQALESTVWEVAREHGERAGR